MSQNNDQLVAARKEVRRLTKKWDHVKRRANTDPDKIATKAELKAANALVEALLEFGTSPLTEPMLSDDDHDNIPGITLSDLAPTSAVTEGTERMVIDPVLLQISEVSAVAEKVFDPPVTVSLSASPSLGDIVPNHSGHNSTEAKDDQHPIGPNDRGFNVQPPRADPTKPSNCAEPPCGPSDRVSTQEKTEVQPAVEPLDIQAASPSADRVSTKGKGRDVQYTVEQHPLPGPPHHELLAMYGDQLSLNLMNYDELDRVESEGSYKRQKTSNKSEDATREISSGPSGEAAKARKQASAKKASGAKKETTEKVSKASSKLPETKVAAKLVWGDLSEEDQETYNEAGAEAITEFVTENIEIPSVLKVMVFQNQPYLPMAATFSAEVAIAFLTSGQGNIRCIHHYNDRKEDKGPDGPDILTGIATSRRYYGERRPLAVHCGCSLDDTLYQFYLWKTLTVRSGNPALYHCPYNMGSHGRRAPNPRGNCATRRFWIGSLVQATGLSIYSLYVPDISGDEYAYRVAIKLRQLQALQRDLAQLQVPIRITFTDEEKAKWYREVTRAEPMTQDDGQALPLSFMPDELSSAAWIMQQRIQTDQAIRQLFPFKPPVAAVKPN